MPKPNDKQDLIRQILSIRILVLTLGEARHANWWKSEFLSLTGLNFCARLYPRSAFAQAIKSTSRSALELHDASIGRGNVFHLFRLPNELEIELDEFLLQNSKELEKEFRTHSDNREILSNLLSSMAGQKGNFKSGPTQVSFEMMPLPSVMASAYNWAFRNNEKIFPYFVQG